MGPISRGLLTIIKNSKQNKQNKTQNNKNSNKAATTARVDSKTVKKIADIVAGKLVPAMPTILRNGGMAAGAMFGPTGAAIGRGAGQFVSQALGFGDYTVRYNTLMKAPPMFGSGARNIRIRHKEYIGDISSSTSYTVTSYSINPANVSMFPWLSNIATSYQQYKMHGMIFYFNSTSATALNSTNTALGTIMMATNYDVREPNFTSKFEIENTFFSSSSKPSEDLMHAIECSPKERPTDVLYVDNTGEGADEPQLYNLGNFQVATVGSQATATIGELWVTYDIELMKPRPSSGVVYTVYSAPTWAVGSIIGTTTPVRTFGNIQLTFNLVTGAITFPKSAAGHRYYVQALWFATVGGNPTGNFAVTQTGFTSADTWYRNATTASAIVPSIADNNTGNMGSISQHVVAVPTAANLIYTLTFTGPTVFAGTPGAFDFVVIQLS